jgi:hypothetical protein
MERTKKKNLHNTLLYILLPENAGGATQHMPHLLQHDEGNIKSPVGRNVLSYVNHLVLVSKHKTHTFLIWQKP